MKVVECGGQGTQLWFEAHLGKITGTRIADVIAKRKRGTDELQCRADMRLDLAVERVTKKPADHFVSYWMERGIEIEPLARASYELKTGTDAKIVDFVLHPTIEHAGCSPDGLIGEDGLVEFKCPKTNTHAEYLLGECVPSEYQPQMLWPMACTGRQWCDFVSYHPDWPEPLDLFVCRLQRDGQRIAMMEAEAEVFLKEVEGVEIRLRHGLAELVRESILPKAVIPNWRPESLGNA
jgi:hypothetical protein